MDKWTSESNPRRLLCPTTHAADRWAIRGRGELRTCNVSMVRAPAPAASISFLYSVGTLLSVCLWWWGHLRCTAFSTRNERRRDWRVACRSPSPNSRPHSGGVTGDLCPDSVLAGASRVFPEALHRRGRRFDRYDFCIACHREIPIRRHPVIQARRSLGGAGHLSFRHRYRYRCSREWFDRHEPARVDSRALRISKRLHGECGIASCRRGDLCGCRRRDITSRELVSFRIFAGHHAAPRRHER